jgi:D-glycero-alpha-D-manno-heptose-7-phosphate kinase
LPAAAPICRSITAKKPAEWSATIDKYIYITVNPKFDQMIRASYSKTEIVETVDELGHELICESLTCSGSRAASRSRQFPISLHAAPAWDPRPATVGPLNASRPAAAGAERLREPRPEIERCGRVMEKQDQYAAAYGGLQYISSTDESLRSIICKPQPRQLSRRPLMLTGMTRAASEILQTQSTNIAESSQKRANLRAMAALAGELRCALQRDNLDDFGAILHDGWQRKRSLADNISSPQIDDWYERARNAGAKGGKLLGAGGGGFLLLYAEEENQPAVLQALPELRAIDFAFEPQGSKIIYVEEPSRNRADEVVSK